MTTWHDFMVERVKGREAGMPWFLHDKVRCYDYLTELGVPTVSVLRRFPTPTDIDLDGLPAEFVLKPTLQSSTKGVMVLSRQDDGRWYDSMRRRTLTAGDIVAEQADLFARSPRGNQIIIEGKILDVDGQDIPRDFKVYAFRGAIAMVTLIDRNTKPSTVSWYDETFRPVNDGRVWSNPKYAHEVPLPAPAGAWSLLRVAATVSAQLPTPFSRIDMYLTERGPVVGEVTLTPGGLYYGVHYQLSAAQQRLMGWMWEHAANDVAASRPPGAA